VYEILAYLTYAAGVTSVLIIGAILRHRHVGHRLLARHPVFLAVHRFWLWIPIWLVTVSFGVCVVIAGGRSGDAFTARAAGWMTFLAVLVTLVWLIVQRTATIRTTHFDFDFRWDSND